MSEIDPICTVKDTPSPDVKVMNAGPVIDGNRRYIGKKCPCTVKRERAEMAMEIDSRVENKLLHISEDKKKYIEAFVDGFMCAFIVIALVSTIVSWRTGE
jgi:hypothetical protein